MAGKKILVHDYAGHPFQVGLSRELARRGHDVVHAYFRGDPGPKGCLQRRNGDPNGLQFVALGASEDDRTSLFARWQSARRYGRALADFIEQIRPTVILSGNTPIEAQKCARLAAARCGAKFVFWCQDLHGHAADALIAHRFLGVGARVAGHIRRLEAIEFQEADAIVAISPEFRNEISQALPNPDKVHVVPNWAVPDVHKSLAEPKGGSSQFRVMYSGTLGLKHDLSLLFAIVDEVGTRNVTIHTGETARSELLRLNGELDVRPLVPYDRVLNTLASANVLIAMLNKGASAFSVPSKVLTYMCAGRPIVLSANADNHAARLINKTGSGRVVEPGDERGFIDAIKFFRENKEAAFNAGKNARAYAEREFDIGKIAGQFEEILFTRSGKRYDEAQAK